MAHGTYAFLKDRRPDLVDLAEKVDEQIGRGEYEQSLQSARKFAEHAVKAVFHARSLPQPPGPMARFFDWLMAPEFKASVPRDIQNACHFLRMRGNMGSHEILRGDAAVPIECLLAARYVYKIAAFLHVAQGGDESLVPPYPAGPPVAPEHPPPHVPRPALEPAAAPGAARAETRPSRSLASVLEAYFTANPYLLTGEDRVAAGGEPGTLQKLLAANDGPRAITVADAQDLATILRPAALEGVEGAVLRLPSQGAVVAVAGDVTLRGLRLRGGSLTIVAGAVRLEECRCETPIVAAGQRARLTLDRTEAVGAPITVAQSAQALVSETRLMEAGGDQLVVAGGAQARLVATTIAAASGAGLRAVDAAIMAEGCTIRSCATAAATGSNGMIELRNCTLVDNATDISESAPGAIRT